MRVDTHLTATAKQSEVASLPENGPVPGSGQGAEPRTVRILYLAHDLGDAAVRRRIAMCEAGGATVDLAGFVRRMSGVAESGPVRSGEIVLGQTADGRMAQRVRAILQALFSAGAVLRGLPKPDIIIARNLEMLVVARRVGGLWGGARPTLIYEVLDIHRMMLGPRMPTRALRRIERRLSQQVNLVITSSPGFVRHYFDVEGRTPAPVRLVENKYLDLYTDGGAALSVTARPARPPLVLGWFGILRCAASLVCLDQVTRAAPGRYRVILRGKPALDAVPDFHAIHAANPDIDYLGPYAPDDLAQIYGEVHVAWLGDRFQAGQNSDWLLPNRLYEACAHGTVPLALADTEAAQQLGSHGLDLTIPTVTPGPVAAALEACDPARLASLQARLAAVAPATWVMGRSDCADLVAMLAGAKGLARRVIGAP